MPAPNRPTSSSGQGSAHSRRDAPREPTLDELWPDYLNGGYFDSAGNLKAGYASRSQMVRLVKAMQEAQPQLTMHQMRRYFQHCRAIEARLRARVSTWPREDAAFRKLDVAAADAFGKTNKKIPQLFHDFIQRNVAVVKTDDDFLKGFLPHFEALVGFGTQFLKERERS